MKSRSKGTQTQLSVMKDELTPVTHPPTKKRTDPFLEDTQKNKCPVCAPLITQLRAEIQTLKEQLQQTKTDLKQDAQTTTKHSNHGLQTLASSSDNSRTNLGCDTISPDHKVRKTESSVPAACVRNATKSTKVTIRNKQAETPCATRLGELNKQPMPPKQHPQATSGSDQANFVPAKADAQPTIEMKIGAEIDSVPRPTVAHPTDVMEIVDDNEIERLDDAPIEQTSIVRQKKSQETEQFMILTKEPKDSLGRRVIKQLTLLTRQHNLLPKVFLASVLLFGLTLIYYYLFRPESVHHKLQNQVAIAKTPPIPLLVGKTNTESDLSLENPQSSSIVGTPKESSDPLRSISAPQNATEPPKQNANASYQEETIESIPEKQTRSHDEFRSDSVKPKKVRGWIRAASKLIRRKKYIKALYRLKRWIQAAPFDPGLRYHYGRALVLQDRPQVNLAIKQFEKAVEFDTAFAEPYYQLSLLYIQLQKPQLAQTALDSFMSLRPKDKRSRSAQKQIYKMN